jgi:hypothetical protein
VVKQMGDGTRRSQFRAGPGETQADVGNGPV